jgi:hypothetical protein
MLHAATIVRERHESFSGQDRQGATQSPCHHPAQSETHDDADHGDGTTLEQLLEEVYPIPDAPYSTTPPLLLHPTVFVAMAPWTSLATEYMKRHFQAVLTLVLRDPVVPTSPRSGSGHPVHDHDHDHDPVSEITCMTPAGTYALSEDQLREALYQLDCLSEDFLTPLALYVEDGRMAEKALRVLDRITTSGLPTWTKLNMVVHMCIFLLGPFMTTHSLVQAQLAVIDHAAKPLSMEDAWWGVMSLHELGFGYGLGRVRDVDFVRAVMHEAHLGSILDLLVLLGEQVVEWDPTQEAVFQAQDVTNWRMLVLLVGLHLDLACALPAPMETLIGLFVQSCVNDGISLREATASQDAFLGSARITNSATVLIRMLGRVLCTLSVDTLIRFLELDTLIVQTMPGPCVVEEDTTTPVDVVAVLNVVTAIIRHLPVPSTDDPWPAPIPLQVWSDNGTRDMYMNGELFDALAMWRGGEVWSKLMAWEDVRVIGSGKDIGHVWESSSGVVGVGGPPCTMWGCGGPVKGTMRYRSWVRVHFKEVGEDDHDPATTRVTVFFDSQGNLQQENHVPGLVEPEREHGTGTGTGTGPGTGFDTVHGASVETDGAHGVAPDEDEEGGLGGLGIAHASVVQLYPPDDSPRKKRLRTS